MAVVLAPELPIANWLEELDALARRSPAFFVGRPLMLDITAVQMEKDDLASLISELNDRKMRIIGIEGADPAMLGFGFPPPLRGGRPIGDIEPEPEGAAASETPAENPQQKLEKSLLIDTPVRSGQSIIFPEGDVTVVGSVASGAEIIAGGSIHVYGTLRGRALAGSIGNPKARIYCRKLDAELLAIDGLYKTADDMDTQLRGKPVQAWLNGDAIIIAGMD